MGFLIKSTSICGNRDEFSSVNMAIDAGQRCISRSHVDKKDIDLLVNIGIYRDRNIVEPAMAALVQRGLSLNNDPIETFDTHSTFAFDMANGAPSFANAVQIIDAMMQNGESKHAMIVASDTHPSRTKHNDFPFSHFGAAMMLTKSDQKTHGNSYFLKASRDGKYGLSATTKLAKNGQNMLNVLQDKDFHERLKAFTVEAINEGVATGQLNLSDIKAIITSQPCRDFGRFVAEGLGYPGNMAVDTFDEYGDTLSSSLILGYYTALEKGLVTENDKVLFVGAGAGLAVGCCVI